MLQRLRDLLEMIRFSHTIFALPFALLSALLAWQKPGSFRWLDLVGILLCMVYFKIFLKWMVSALFPASKLWDTYTALLKKLPNTDLFIRLRR